MTKRKRVARAICRARAKKYGEYLTESEIETYAPKYFPEAAAAIAAMKPEKSNDRKRGTRLTEDWWPDEAGIKFAASLKLQLENTVWIFRDYWIAKPGKDGLKLDWSATWRNWCRNQAKWGAERKAQRPPSQGVVAGALEDIAELEGQV